jgi:predicted DNA-binding protein (MmcQ/YjbR family)
LQHLARSYFSLCAVDLECFRQYCLSLPAITEGFPFNDSSLVREVAGKMFALTDVDLSASISMKYDPEQPLGLHERYAAVQPG